MVKEILALMDIVIGFIAIPFVIFVGSIGTFSALIASERRRSYFLAAIFGGVFGLFGGMICGLAGAAAATWFVFAFGPGIPRKICASLGTLFGIILQTAQGWTEYTEYAVGPTTHLQSFVLRCLVDSALAAAIAAPAVSFAYLRKN